MRDIVCALTVLATPQLQVNDLLFMTGADPGGGPRGPGPPPVTLGFEAPKLSIFGPYLIFP